jgi:hypothetical protein
MMDGMTPDDKNLDDEKLGIYPPEGDEPSQFQGENPEVSVSQESVLQESVLEEDLFQEETPPGVKVLEALKSDEVLHPWHASAGVDGFEMTPANPEQIAQILNLASEQGQPLTLNELDMIDLKQPVWLNLKRLSQVKNHRVQDLVITVETGITFQDLRDILKTEKQEFPLHYPPETLLVDILAEDRPALETGFLGYPRDYVLGVEFVTPDGAITHYGAEVVKNATGYDLNKLYVGSYHTLGVLSQVTLKLSPLLESTRSWLFEFETVHQAFQTVKRLLGKELPLTCCEIYQSKRLGAEEHSKSIAPWQMLLEVRGDLSLLKQVNPMVRELVVFPESESNLLPLREDTLLTLLSRWPEDALVVEVSVSMGQLEDLYYRISTEFLGEGIPLLQMRPAAGLIYLIWTPEMLTSPETILKSLRNLQAKLQKTSYNPKGLTGWLEGAVQIVQFSSRGLKRMKQAAAQFNLPQEPILLSLMERIKATYDPKGVLYSRRLPLQSRGSLLIGSPVGTSIESSVASPVSVGFHDGK